MLKLMACTWEPILGRFRGHADGSRAEDMPTWDDFRTEYARELPGPTPARSSTLTDDLLIDFIRRRPVHRAGGMDG